MGKIEIHYNGRTPEIRQAEEVVSGQLRSMEVQFTFSEDWEAYPLRTSVFKSRRASRMWPLDGEGKAKIPGDVIRTGVRSITVSVFGFAEMEGGEYLRYNGKPAAFRVEIGGDIPGEGCPDADPTAYELIMISLSAKLDANQGSDNAGRVLVVGEDGIVRPGEYSGGGGSGGGGVNFRPDETLTLTNGVLSVNTADAAEAGNMLPVTSNAVYQIVGNIEALLKTI